MDERTEADNGDKMTDAPVDSLLVDAKTAARLCNIGRTTWLSLDSAGKTPECVRLGRRVLWDREELAAWVHAKCPPRERWRFIHAENN